MIEKKSYKEYVLNCIKDLKNDEEIEKFIICQYGIILLAKGLAEYCNENIE